MSGPLPRSVAWRATARCMARSLVLLARRQVVWPRGTVGWYLTFADGTVGRVYRETAVALEPKEPCVLVVTFRLRWVRGRGHAVFERESVLNTPLFVGYDGFVSKLWLAHDDRGRYRGLYEWDGAEQAEYYARSLWRVLELVSEPGSIDYHVVPDVRRDTLLADPDRDTAAGTHPWWRVVEAP
ncbi:hypothetical protein FFT09_06720 [Saccharomonospora piscinae]|nr:hypothetical protein FFT09_06720 [Saccharomonospora piscinae]